jgi:hypothetical protein
MTFIEKFTDDFVNEWNGRTLNVNGANINFDGRYGTQCMDLWNYWWLELELTGIPRHVDAAAVWEDFGGKHYEYFDGILPNEPAKKGDIFIYNRNAWGTGFGHIGLVLADNGNSILVLETNGLGDGYEDEYMNQYGSPPRIHEWPKTNLYGYLRLIEDDMDADAKKKLEEIHARVFGRDVQRWMNPKTGAITETNTPGFWALRSADLGDIAVTQNLINDNTNKILNAIKNVPGIDSKVIEELKKELTSNISVVLKSE